MTPQPIAQTFWMDVLSISGGMANERTVLMREYPARQSEPHRTPGGQSLSTFCVEQKGLRALVCHWVTLVDGCPNPVRCVDEKAVEAGPAEKLNKDHSEHRHRHPDHDVNDWQKHFLELLPLSLAETEREPNGRPGAWPFGSGSSFVHQHVRLAVPSISSAETKKAKRRLVQSPVHQCVSNHGMYVLHSTNTDR